MMKVDFTVVFILIALSPVVYADSGSCDVPDIQNGDFGRYLSSAHFEKFDKGHHVKHNETLHLRCHDGFFPTENLIIYFGNRPEIRCNDGTWSEVFECKAAPCFGETPNVDNGQSIILSREHGSYIWYKCNNDMIKRSNITCHFGSWVGKAPKCLDKVSCKEPQAPENGTVSLSGDLKVGSLAKYSCDPGKMLYGATSTECLITGQWTFDPPKCIGDCEIPRINGGSVRNEVLGDWYWSWGRFKYDRDVSYEIVRRGSFVSPGTVHWLYCERPYSVHGKGKEREAITCSKGRWSLDLVCLRGVRCRKLKRTDLMEIQYTNDREIGSLATFHCFVPGKRSGVSHTKCLENGSWEDPTPTCTIPSCSLDDLLSAMPQNALLVTDNSNNISFPYNSTVKLACKNDMIAVRNPVAKCETEGKWNIDRVQCASVCLTPTKPPGSKLKFSPEQEIYKFGERLAFSCPSGMKLSTDSEVIMCLKSGWSETLLPKCEEEEDYYEDF